MAGPARGRWLAAALLAMMGPLAACASPQRFAAIGDLPLEQGGVIRDCVIGYRTFGRLDAGRSNAVLFLPWFLGRSADLAWHVGPGRLIDTDRYFVIAVDGLGNGVSTSPSNSPTQGGASFPRYTQRDAVMAQHRLVTEVLGLSRLHAVVGTSMGAMHVFQWVTTFPTAMTAAVAIAGTPAMTTHDRLAWQGRAAEVMETPAWRRARGTLFGGHPLDAVAVLRGDRHDYARQVDALISGDVTAAHGGSLGRAAQSVQAALLVVVSGRDDILDPGAARAFAAARGTPLLELDGRCGHDAPACEKATLWPAVDAFLHHGTAPAGHASPVTPEAP